MHGIRRIIVVVVVTNRNWRICLRQMRSKGRWKFSGDGSVCKRRRGLRRRGKCRIFDLSFIAEDFNVNWGCLYFET